MSAPDFGFIQSLVRAKAGMLLEPGKEYLAESRLLPLAHDEGMRTTSELVARLRANGDAVLLRRVIEAMTTKETYFFRDYGSFEILRKRILPELLRRRESSRRLNIWCAACSSGQEPYSVAMMLLEICPSIAQWHVTLLGTDIASTMLEQAVSGRYNQTEINRGLPASLLVKYFERDGLEWIVAERVRRMVEFQEANLAGEWPSMPHLDLILMRNVLIYLDQPTRKTVLGKTRRALRPDGFLFLGGAETTFTLDDAFESAGCDGHAFYRLRGGTE